MILINHLIMKLLTIHHDMRNIAVIGGWDGRKALNSVEFYNEQKREWEESRRTRLAQERRSPITATQISVSISIKFVKFSNFNFQVGCRHSDLAQALLILRSEEKLIGTFSASTTPPSLTRNFFQQNKPTKYIVC